MTNVPTIEPVVLTAGDTWKWKRSLADYPAPTWSIRYVLSNATQRYTFDSDADGTDHLVSRTPAETSPVVPGRYHWTAFALDGTDRYQIGGGTFEVRPNVEGGRPWDTRTTARQIYDALLELQLSHASGRALVAEYTIAGRSMRFRDSDDLLAQLAYWKGQVDAEEAAERQARGQSSGLRVLARI